MSAARESATWKRVTVAIPYLWLRVFFLLPFVIILKISLADPVIAKPPFTPMFDDQGNLSVSLDGFIFLLTDKLYVITYLKSVMLAASATLLCLLLEHASGGRRATLRATGARGPRALETTLKALGDSG